MVNRPIKPGDFVWYLTTRAVDQVHDEIIFNLARAYICHPYMSRNDEERKRAMADEGIARWLTAAYFSEHDRLKTWCLDEPEELAAFKAALALK